MADSKMAVSQWSPEFVQGLLSSAQKMAPLYHLSSLYLANFTNLETIIRIRVFETRLLFESSDATLLKCIFISENLVATLLPMVKTAGEENMSISVVHFLEKARTWIKDIINDVDKIVERYDLHNQDVASFIVDVDLEKENTNKKILEQYQELKLMEEALNTMKSELQKTTAETEEKIRSKTQEIRDFTNRKSIPDPVYLLGAQKSLTRIKDILIQLRNFWESVAQMLDYLEVKTFVGEFLIKDLAELKDIFLNSIKEAAEAWSCFGDGCKKASVIFKLQNKDAYKFLEVSPSSLSKEEWHIQHESVKKQLCCLC